MQHLREQMSFLEMGAAEFDRGNEAAAKVLALTIRALVDDTPRQTCLLSQLGIKTVLRFVDTAVPIDPRNLLPTLGLVMIMGSPEGVRYIAPLGDGDPERYGHTKPFDRWWSEAISTFRDHTSASRENYVLAAANREGGAHVDPHMDPLFAKFARDNPFGWMWAREGEAPRPISGHGALASIRQIAYEIQETLQPVLVQ